MDEMISKALATYVPLLAKAKDKPYRVSGYTVQKPWGFEKWLDITPYYAFKLIHMRQGFKCSLQMHETKVESSYVLSGIVQVYLEDPDGTIKVTDVKPGEGWVVKPGQKHQATAVTDYTVIEVSSPHVDDVIRYHDEYGRGNGYISAEHIQD